MAADHARGKIPLDALQRCRRPGLDEERRAELLAMGAVVRRIRSMGASGWRESKQPVHKRGSLLTRGIFDQSHYFSVQGVACRHCIYGSPFPLIPASDSRFVSITRGKGINPGLKWQSLAKTVGVT